MMFLMFPVPRAVEPREPRSAATTTEEVEMTDTARAQRARATWAPWSPLQLIVAGLGGFLVVLGVLAISSAGFNSWTEPDVAVWGFRHTPLMAGIEIVLGLALLSATTSPFAARTTLMGFGALMAVFGAIVLVEPKVFGDLLGANRQMGVLYTAAGCGGIALSSLVPIVR